MEKKEIKVLVHGSGKHCHLTEEHMHILFGPDAKMEVVRHVGADGKGDYVTTLKVEVIGPQGKSFKCSVLGPPRKNSQVEVSFTEGRMIGVEPPLALKGHEGTMAVKLRGTYGELELPYGLYVPARHVHLTWDDSLAIGVSDGEMCDLRVEGERALVFHNVVARVAPKGVPMELSDVHLDYDEFNAAALFRFDGGWLSKGE